MTFANLQAMQMVPHFAKIEIPAPARISIFLLVAHPPIPLIEHCSSSNGYAFSAKRFLEIVTKAFLHVNFLVVSCINDTT